MLESPSPLREVRVRRLSSSSILLAVAVALSACGDDPPPAAPSVAPPAFHHVEMEGGGMVRDLGAPGATLQLRVSAVFDDGSRSDVTSEAAWSVDDPGIATVSPLGLVSAVGPGTVTVTATYRERASIANLRVAALFAFFRVTGVVRDAVLGAPIAGAEVRAGAGPGQTVAVSDGSGYFELPAPGREITFLAAALGYADDVRHIAGVTSDLTLDVALRLNPGAYIERTLEAWFEAFDPSHAGIARVPISTRSGGWFDAEATSDTCDYNGWLELTAESGGVRFTGTHSQGGGCRARVRFVVPDGRIALTIRGYKASSYRLRFREPR
jgi:hypothetical protein